jgi:hypothetical protein
VKHPANRGDYEPLRTWALHPSSIRPTGLAQLLCGGMVTWLQAVQPLPVTPLRESTGAQAVSGITPAVSLLVAAMIAEVLL